MAASYEVVFENITEEGTGRGAAELLGDAVVRIDPDFEAGTLRWAGPFAAVVETELVAAGGGAFTADTALPIAASSALALRWRLEAMSGTLIETRARPEGVVPVGGVVLAEYVEEGGLSTDVFGRSELDATMRFRADLTAPDARLRSPDTRLDGSALFPWSELRLDVSEPLEAPLESVVTSEGELALHRETDQGATYLVLPPEGGWSGSEVRVGALELVDAVGNVGMVVGLALPVVSLAATDHFGPDVGRAGGWGSQPAALPEDCGGCAEVTVSGVGFAASAGVLLELDAAEPVVGLRVTAELPEVPSGPTGVSGAGFYELALAFFDGTTLTRFPGSREGRVEATLPSPATRGFFVLAVNILEAEVINRREATARITSVELLRE